MTPRDHAAEARTDIARAIRRQNLVLVCLDEIEDIVRETAVKAMRRYRGAVSPIVTLGDLPMRTRFGERRRPHFNVVGDTQFKSAEKIAGPEYCFHASSTLNLSQPAPDHVKNRLFTTAEELEELYTTVPELRPHDQRHRAKPPKSSSAIDSMKHVAPLTKAEELNDEIPW